MAEVDPAKTPSLVEHYLLEGKDKTPETAIKPVEEADAKTPVNAIAEEVKETGETPAGVDNTEVPTATPVVAENTETIEGSNEAAGGESTESVPPVEPTSQDNHAASEEVSESAESDSSPDQEAVDETPEIKLETAPADFRFPTTNQSRHCFTRYIEYHRCIAAKGDDAPECQKFAKYYRSLCPGEWIDRWNEQRENGTFPGPL